ncbi:hypothetical protein K439DRAFT_1612170 [Ramaria rubella]|nr:hypothetical protein K439DRAFT_1612170 [Ramaria rubella]
MPDLKVHGNDLNWSAAATMVCSSPTNTPTILTLPPLHSARCCLSHGHLPANRHSGGHGSTHLITFQVAHCVVRSTSPPTHIVSFRRTIHLPELSSILGFWVMRRLRDLRLSVHKSNPRRYNLSSCQSLLLCAGMSGKSYVFTAWNSLSTKKHPYPSVPSHTISLITNTATGDWEDAHEDDYVPIPKHARDPRMKQALEDGLQAWRTRTVYE